MSWSLASTTYDSTQKARTPHNPKRKCANAWSDDPLDLIWCLLASTLFSLYMSWRRSQPARSFTKWTLGLRRLNSMCSWLNRLFATLVIQCLMWFMLIHLWSVSCSTLHYLLRLNACCHSTCETTSKVPTLSIQVCPATPDASARRTHFVQVCPECPFGSMTLWNHWEHPHTYKFIASNCSHFSYRHANNSLQFASALNMLTAPGVIGTNSSFGGALG